MDNKAKNIVIYEAKSVKITLPLDKKNKTVWARQDEISKLFGIDRSVVSKHINKIFKDNEVLKKNNVQKMHIAISDKPVNYYSLDVILAVGYRANSARAISFRKWATSILQKYILQGNVVNRDLIQQNYNLFLESVNQMRTLIPKDKSVDSFGVIEIIKIFADTWLSLNAYDKKELPDKGYSLSTINITANELTDSIQLLRQQLILNKSASELFASEIKAQAISNIFKNVFQTYNGTDLYPSIEEKAANLLYLIVKDHPFVDGNKRSGAFSFIWFLRKAGILNTIKISPEVLTTLTILVAESKMEDKKWIIGIILLMLK